MLRKNKMILLGKDSMGTYKMMESEPIYRNFHPEVYAKSIIDGIKAENIPNFEDAVQYVFIDKGVEFKLENIQEFRNEYTIYDTNLYDVIYVINISDEFDKIIFKGDCIAEPMKQGVNLAPRTMTVFLLDKHYQTYLDSNNNRRFVKIYSEESTDLEYNIYMTRLL